MLEERRKSLKKFIDALTRLHDDSDNKFIDCVDWRIHAAPGGEGFKGTIFHTLTVVSRVKEDE